ncbi:hypothetical protein SUGI_0567260, partial [Cryptomeria japonica]
MAPTYPDWTRRHKICDVPPYVTDSDCRPIYKGETPRKFEFPTGLPMRTRVAAHKASDFYVGKYVQAVELMKKLPDEDPRNFTEQAKIHAAYCHSAYYMGKTDKAFKVHGGWFFLPWHRWYLYFYERILAKLLGDDTFALPFWNWDFEGGMTIPLMYMDHSFKNDISPLYDENRNPEHANAFVDLGYGKIKKPISSLSRENLIWKNYMIMFMQVVVLGASTRTFHGEKITETSSKCTCGAGTLEYMPHNTVHNWTGTVPTGKKDCDCPSKTCYGEDMGIFYSAARDPIFFAHHANVDRVWTLWKTQLDGKDYDDPDLLDTKFYFYDENAKFVEVRAGDAFDPEKLRYKYEDSPSPWLIRPIPWLMKPIAAAAIERAAQCTLPTLDLQTNPTFSGPVKLTVPRDPPSSTIKELLVIEGIRAQRNIAVKFDVFVQLDDCLAATPYVDTMPPEYAGTFVELPRGDNIDDPECGCGQSSVHTVISEVLGNLGVGQEEESIKCLCVFRSNNL